MFFTFYLARFIGIKEDGIVIKTKLVWLYRHMFDIVVPRRCNNTHPEYVKGYSEESDEHVVVDSTDWKNMKYPTNRILAFPEWQLHCTFSLCFLFMYWRIRPYNWWLHVCLVILCRRWGYFYFEVARALKHMPYKKEGVHFARSIVPVFCTCHNSSTISMPQ